MPEVIDIPEVGQVEFPDGMSETEITRASKKLWLQSQQAAARKEGELTEAMERGISRDAAWADFILRPWASTPENPLGAIGTIGSLAGAVVNESGRAAKEVYKGVAGSYGLPTGRIDEKIVETIPLIAGSMATEGALSPVIANPAARAATAFGVVPAAATLEATGSTPEAVKAGIVGAMIPGVAQAGREAATLALGKAVEVGALSAGANTTQKIAEALAAQGAIQVFMEGMSLPDYVAMTPEDRKQALLDNLAVNAAFLLMDVPGLARKGQPSATQERLSPAVKVGEVMERLVNDPGAAETLRMAADQFAFEALDPRNAQRQVSMVTRETELATVPPELVDPAAATTESSTVAGKPTGMAEPASPETRRPPAVESPRPEAPARKAPTAPVAEPNAPAPEPKTPRPKRPTLGSTVDEVLQSFGELRPVMGEQAVIRVTGERPVISTPDGLARVSAFKTGRGTLSGYELLKPSEVAELRSDISRGIAQVELQTTGGALGEYGKQVKTVRVLHQATGQPLVEPKPSLVSSAAAEGGVEATTERATLPRRIEGETAGPAIDQPVSLSEIREYLSTALDIPVRVRGFRQQAVGIFKQRPEVIRQKLLNDIPTLAHETGHYLHYILFPSGDRLSPNPRASTFAQRFDPELMALGAATSRPGYSPAKVRREGVAEFVREWLTNPSAAAARAPTFHPFFEASLKRDFPEVWKILKRAQADIRRYIQQPAAAKIDSMISVGRDDPSEPLTRRLQRFADNWINDLGPIERSMRRLQEFGLPPATAKTITDYAVNYIGGWRGKAQSDLFYKQADLNGREIGPGLREILGGIDDLQSFRRYLVAKRVLEKNAQGKTTGVDSADARAVVTADASKFEAKRQQLLAFQRNARDLLVESGLLNASQAKAMDRLNEDYVPFHRVYESVAGGKGSGEGFINLGQGIHAFKGSDRTIIDPLESIIKNVYLFRDLAERNRVGAMFTNALDATRGSGRIADAIAKRLKPVTVNHAEMVKALKDAGIDTQGLGLEDLDLTFKVWRMARQSKPADGIFTVWKQGQEQPYQLDDPELYRALSLADSTAARIFNAFPLARAAQFLTRTLRAGATLSPEFIARNPFRDQITAGVFSRYGFVPFWDGFRGALSAVGRDHWYRDWVKAGGRYSDFVAMDRTDLQSTLADVIKEPTALRFALDLANPLNVLRNLQKFSEFMEQATRISEFRRAKQAGASDLEAANASKEVTLNFARGGFKGKALNQIAAFFNASVQDWSKFMREHNYARDPKRALQVQAKALLYITVPSVLAWWLGKDDEEIQNLPAWRKNFFWNINLRSIFEPVGIQSEDFILSFPKPFLLGQLYGSSVERGLDYVSERDPNAVRKWASSFVESVPVHPQNLLPTALRPAVETAANYSFFTGQPIENQGQQALPPDFRIGSSTSQSAQMLAQMLPWDWATPLRLDNLARGYFGSLSKYGTDAADYALAKSGLVDVPEPVEKTIWERPVLRAFIQSPYEPSDYVRRFFDGYELAEQRLTALRKGPEFIDSDRMQTWARANREPLAFYLTPVGQGSMITELRSARESLGEIIKAMAQVKQSRELTGPEKAEKLRTLAGVRDRMAEAAYRTYLAPADRAKVF